MIYEVEIERIDKVSEIFGRVVKASSRRVAVVRTLREWTKEHSGERWKELSVRVYARSKPSARGPEVLKKMLEI